jgi:hypothetical protein
MRSVGGVLRNYNGGVLSEAPLIYRDHTHPFDEMASVHSTALLSPFRSVVQDPALPITPHLRLNE